MENVTEDQYKILLDESDEGELSPEKMQKLNLYRTQKVVDINRKVNLGIVQVIASIKKTPWCSRLSLCFEIFFKIKNKNYNEFGEYIGKNQKEKNAPWCVILGAKIQRFFSNRVPT